MPNMLVSGAGVSAANGVYVWYRSTWTCNGASPCVGDAWRRVVGADTYYLINNSEWDIILNQEPNTIPVLYYNSNSAENHVASPDLCTSGWTVGGGGTSPAPTVALAPVAPTVTTQAVSSIAETTATGNGNVTADGGATITERGTCIGTSANPTTAGTKFTAAGTTGAFTTAMTGLTGSTLYHVRAYAINSVGTSYGSDVTFTTDAPPWRFENLVGIVYDSADHKTIFAERLNEILDRLYDLDGLNPEP